MSRRTRLIAVIAGIPALLIVVALIAVYVMLQPQRFTATVRQAANSAGLQLALAAPAQPSLWPRPGVVLRGVTLTAQDSQTPLLLATRVRLVVPWHTVLGGKTTISALELDAPRVDLDGLQQFLARQTSSGPTTATLPGIDAGVTVHDGSLVQNDSVIANHIELHTGALHPGNPFELSASARTVSGTQYALKLHTTPQKKPGHVNFDPLKLTLSSGHRTHMQLDGTASWAGGASIQSRLEGSLHRASGQTYALTLTTTPASQSAPMNLHLRIQGKGLNADLHLPPTELASWWKQVSGPDQGDGALDTPPVTGTLQADKLQMGSVSIEGLELKSGPDVPAPGGTAAKAPAAGADPR